MHWREARKAVAGGARGWLPAAHGLLGLICWRIKQEAANREIYLRGIGVETTIGVKIIDLFDDGGNKIMAAVAEHTLAIVGA